MVTPDYLSAYSDASSSYWPPGWNFARFANSTVEEYASLSDEERNKMHAGFRDALGQDGFAELSEIMFQEELRIMREEERKQKQLASGSTAPIPLTEAPQWLRTSREKYRDQPWGFLAFYLSPPPPPRAAVGTASSDSDASTQQQQHQRQKFQDTVWEMTEVPFNTAVNEDHLDANEARSNFEIRWVEVVASADDEEATVLDRLRCRYREMVEQQEISWRFAQTLFLVANVSSVSSVLAVPESIRLGKYGRPNAPFLLAVETVDGQIDPTDEEAERLRYAPVFKVAIEALVEELWHSVEGQTLSMETLTRWVRKARLVEDSNEGRQTDDDLDDIWWTAHAPSHHIRKKRGLE